MVYRESCKLVKRKLDSQSVEMEADLRKAKPVGNVCKTEGSGRALVLHYSAFELRGFQYQLENTVLVKGLPEGKCTRPYVAIVKSIKQITNGSLTLLLQWLYRPEEALKSGRRGCHDSSESRELYYSHHTDDVTADSVMHKCVVHYIPHGKQLPLQSRYPGHVVRSIYDVADRRLWKLQDHKNLNLAAVCQQEIQQLLERTRLVLGGDLADEELPNQDSAAIKEDRRRKLEVLVKQQGHRGGCHQMEQAGINPLWKMHRILQTRNALIEGNITRNRCLEKLLQAVKYLFPGQERETKKPAGCKTIKVEKPDVKLVTGEGDKDIAEFSWPDTAVSAVCALESCVHDAHATDVAKYNLKMRSLELNLKNNATLARRLLLKELVPASVLRMSPAELKAGITSAEQTAKEIIKPQLAELKLPKI